MFHIFLSFPAIKKIPWLNSFTKSLQRISSPTAASVDFNMNRCNAVEGILRLNNYLTFKGSRLNFTCTLLNLKKERKL